MTAFCGQCGGRVGATPVDPMIGMTLDGRYLIESKIAAGGFGTVYRARAGEQLFAIKVLQTQHSSDPAVSARFRREAVTMSSLANRHTVTTFELGEDRSGAQFIVMELLEGESLQDRFTACGLLHWRSVLSIVRAVCDSLAEAHGLGIVHRDLKPANIFLARQPADFVKVLDFGIAKILHGSNMHDGNELTRIGQAIGTLEYMSPEQLIGGELDSRTDLYTLGVVAYEMIAGHRPFSEVTGATGLVTALMTRKPPPLSTVVSGPLPPALDGVLARCLERDATDRYADIRELAHAIDRMLAETPHDLFTTQRQWGGNLQQMSADDHEDEITVVDTRPLFDSKPPVDEPCTSITPRSAMAQLPVEPATNPHFEAVMRAEAIAPRAWRAQGTGVPFVEGLPDDERTGARPLYATRWAIGTEAADGVPVPARFGAGSSPLIDQPVMQPIALPLTEPAHRGVLGLAGWAVGLTALGLGIGAAIAMLAG